jgi:uncharacterized phage protein (predicted DNA packaging)
MLDKVKQALRISHNFLNNDIRDTIEAARAEMIRSGVSVKAANNDSDQLIVRAIKTFCLGIYESNQKLAEGYQKSWEYQIDNLRKSSSYAESGDENV